jgi:hypothetical protein
MLKRPTYNHWVRLLSAAMPAVNVVLTDSHCHRSYRPQLTFDGDNAINLGCTVPRACITGNKYISWKHTCIYTT